MDKKENCGICGQPLVYGNKEIIKRCDFCGRELPFFIHCPAGHYICDDCHSRAALDILKDVLSWTESADPVEILEKVMAHPAVPMHGPEHHAMVPAILLTAIENAGYPIPEGAVEKALERGSKVPGGWCGFFGACGAGIGVGIAVSVLTGATPLTGKTRGLANEATSYVLRKMVDNGPRCCKRAARRALELGAEFLLERLDIKLDISKTTDCNYVARNKECIGEDCPYFKK